MQNTIDQGLKVFQRRHGIGGAEQRRPNEKAVEACEQKPRRGGGVEARIGQTAALGAGDGGGEPSAGVFVHGLKARGQSSITGRLA